MRLSAVALTFLLMICDTPWGADNVPSPLTAEQYLRTAIEKLEQSHINRGRVDWSSIRLHASAQINDTSSIEDTYPVIRDVIRQLDEPHTFFVAPQRSSSPSVNAATAKPPKVLTAMFGRIGYMLIPTFALRDTPSAIAFATDVRMGLVRLSKEPICGWMIDLRHNEGGNMFPALLGLAPLIGNGKVGGIRSGAVPQFWHYLPDKMLLSDRDELPQSDSDFVDREPKAQLVRGVREILATTGIPTSIGKATTPIAVAIGRATSSAGEAIAIALLGLENSKSFGDPTAGRTTGNIGVRMPDGAFLIITVGAFEDRNGLTYLPKVVPTEVIGVHSPFTGLPPESDVTLTKASEWIYETSKCKPLIAPSK